MPTCLLCAKSGWFLKVSPDMLCDVCNYDYLSTVTRSAQIIEDSIKIIQSSKNPMTRLSRIKVAIENCDRIDRFARAGLKTISPAPRDLADKLAGARKDVVEDFVHAELIKVRARASSARTRSSRASPYSRLLEKVAAFYSELEDVAVVDQWDQAIRRELSAVEIKAEIEEAERQEHRGQITKALNLYKDALFTLNRSELSEEERADIAGRLNAKIAKLEGRGNPRVEGESSAP